MSLSLEQIDRTIFELIRLGLVTVGYLPDWRTTPGTGAAKMAAFEAAKVALYTAGNTPIDVYGVGTDVARDSKLKNRITISREGIKNGLTSKWGAPQFVQNLTAPPLPNGQQPFDMQFASNPAILEYEIRIFAGSTKYERIAAGVLLSVLGIARRDARAVDSLWVFSGESFPIVFGGSVKVSATPETIEYIYNYRVSEVKITPCVVIQTGISPIVDIPVGIDTLPLTDTLLDIPPTGGAEITFNV